MADRLRMLVVGVPRVARALADAGHEVVYLDGDPSPAMIAATAMQEAVDAVVAPGTDATAVTVPVIHVADDASDIAAAIAASGLRARVA